MINNSPTKIYKDLDLSLAFTTNYDVAKRVDVNAVKQSIKNLLLTRPGERPFQPDVGSELYRILFEPMDVLTAEALKGIITTCIRNYEPRVRLQDVMVMPRFDENAFDISLYFYVIGIYAPVVFNLTLQRLR
jgi:phage baseplate assembly protein W